MRCISRGDASVTLSLGDFAFKENGIRLIADAVSQDRRVAIEDATDVLRLAAAMYRQ